MTKPNPLSLLFIFCLSLFACEQEPKDEGSVQSKAPTTTLTQLEGNAEVTDEYSADNYAWTDTYDESQSLYRRIHPPNGYERVKAAKNSFAWWLRGLPLKVGRPDVLLYNGQKKGNQSAHRAIISIDVGKRDLQQCADAVMRLRAEYLYAQDQDSKIHFNFTSGDRADYTKYRDGYRPKISGNNVSWSKKTSADASHRTFRKYMDLIFSYCGTASLEKELKTREPKKIQIGDVFIQGGFPGHAVLVVDMAQDPETEEKVFLLAQSYMPAQEMHILNNPKSLTGNPWYYIDTPRDIVNTPEWTFSKNDLKYFPQ